MELTVKEQVKYWGIAALVFLLLLWVLGDVILPFVIGGAIAYFLDPLADRLERIGLSRLMATVIISLAALMVFTLLLLLVLPMVIQQGAALIEAAPSYVDAFQNYINLHYPQLLDEQSTMRQTLNTVAAAVQDRASDFTDTILQSLFGVINAAIFIVVVPVVAFYMLLDWDRMIARVRSLLPREHAPTIYRLAGEINVALAGFIRGQLTVCIILGAWYGLSLMGVGLQYGLFIGVFAGMIAFIPYLGTFVGGVTSIGVALYQYWNDPFWIFLVIGIFVIGQMVEGNYLTPKLVGESVGLHPVWLLFALSAFGALFGFVGMLVAVPVSAAIGVICRFLVERYKDSRLYRGAPRPLDVDDL